MIFGTKLSRNCREIALNFYVALTRYWKSSIFINLILFDCLDEESGLLILTVLILTELNIA